MCRSIKTLRDESELSVEDVRAAALQYVRKVSGYRKPSRANQDAFDAAVADITEATSRLLDSLVTRPAPSTQAAVAEGPPTVAADVGR